VDAPNLRWLDRFEPGAEGLLGRACELVAHGWCQRTEAEDADGAGVPPWSERARSWSLLGALVAAVDLPAEPGPITLRPLRRALAALAEIIDEPLLAEWNDQPGRTQDEVVRTLAAARSLCAGWSDETRWR
jgi:hypothetical protein